MPAFIDATSQEVGTIELQRQVDDCWENLLLPTSTKDDEWVITPHTPNILAGIHPRPNTIFHGDSKITLAGFDQASKRERARY